MEGVSVAVSCSAPTPDFSRKHLEPTDKKCANKVAMLQRVMKSLGDSGTSLSVVRLLLVPETPGKKTLVIPASHAVSLRPSSLPSCLPSFPPPSLLSSLFFFALSLSLFLLIGSSQPGTPVSGNAALTF